MGILQEIAARLENNPFTDHEMTLSCPKCGGITFDDWDSCARMSCPALGEIAEHNGVEETHDGRP